MWRSVAGRCRCRSAPGRPLWCCVSVPHAVRPYADQVVAATDAVCLEHLDVEYAGLCRRVVGKLGRKRPSPLTRGDLGIWAAGVVYVVGQLNLSLIHISEPTSRTP